MISKNCLFKSIKENIRRNIYLLILIALGFIVVFPLRTIMILDRAQANQYIEGAITSVQEKFLECIGMENITAMIFIGMIAVLLGLMGFFYLYSSEKTDFYHSLPLKREELFIIPFVSGIFIFLLPYLLSVGITYLIGFAYHGVSAVSAMYTFTAIGMNILLFLELYVFAIFAVLLTGNLFTGVLAFLGCMSYGWIVYTTYSYMNNSFFGTLAYFQSSKIVDYLSPITAHIYAVDNWLIGKTSLRGYILYAVVLIVLVLIADICIYKVRPSESFHKSIAFQKLQSVIKIFAVLPISLLASLFFCAGMEHEFIWLIISVVVLSFVLSCVFEFLFTMDIRKCIAPKISTGVILVILAVILAGYKVDILKVDSYLPDKDKIETMSVYLPSVNDKMSYPSKYDLQVEKQMEKSQTKDFDAVYELAKLGIDYSEHKGVEKNHLKVLDNSIIDDNTVTSDENVMVSLYVGYYLKNGRTVYRAYYVPETEKLLSLVSDIYDNWDYKETMLPTSYLSEKDLEYLYVRDLKGERMQINASKDTLENIYKTYKGELESMSFAQSRTGRILGYLSVEEKINSVYEEQKEEEKDQYNREIELPIYENFSKTRDLLENAGQPVNELSPEEILDITIYVPGGSDGDPKEEVIEDKGEIEKILSNLTYESGHYSLGSGIDYQVSLNISFEDRNRKVQSSLYLMEGKVVDDLLKKLNID